jgi:prepilin-type N-terminal cleavage/methylation domain-containing protein
MKISRSSNSRSGFTLVELMIVVAIIGLLTSLAVPNLARARDTSRLNVIYSNLRVLEAAKEQWALDKNQATGTPVPDLTTLTGYLRWDAIHDVMHETYVPNPVGTPAEADLPSGASLRPYGPGAAITSPVTQ